ncbi:MAG TPA: hypothetical protein VNV66_10085 [Pilimelia sp.]|nr:hypothetical protein [Pilimelia sp.]
MAYSSGADAGRRRLPLAARIAIALSLVSVGVVGGFSFGFMALLQLGGFASQPWQLWFAAYSLGAVVSLAVPTVAWWFLFPRVRWWGVATMAVALACYTVLSLLY